MKTKLAILTVLCSASLWAWAQAVGGSSPAGKPPVGAPASPPNGAPGNAPNNGFNKNSGTMPPFTSPGNIPPSNGTNGMGDGGSKQPGILPNNMITNHPGIVKPNTRFYNSGTTN